MTEANQNNSNRRSTWLRDILLLTASALLLNAAYPKINAGWAAWFAFVPLFCALDGKSARRSLVYGYLFGLIFFNAGLSWIGVVDPLARMIGAPLLCAYLSMYYALFAYGFSKLAGHSLPVRLCAAASLFVCLEYARAYLLSGFSFLNLSHSQWLNTPIIQISDLTGAYGVSFLVVLCNLVLFEIKKKVVFRLEPQESKPLVFVTGVFVVLYSLAWLYNGSFDRRMTSASPSIRVGIVQGNIAQEIKWEESEWPGIIDKHKALTRKLVSDNQGEQKLDLIVWPETAFPGFVGGKNPFLFGFMKYVDALDIPLIFGGVADENGQYFNSAIHVTKQGQIKGRYDKLKLVPFGEYIPFRKYIPAVSRVVPIADFSTGKDYNLLEVTTGTQSHRFATPICFEDIFEQLARGFVRNGAEAFINITNDAWFEDTKGVPMHMISSVFRSIETRRWTVRAGNTGISVFIDEQGKLHSPVIGEGGRQMLVAGYSAHTIHVSKDQTFYVRFGNIFIYLCFLFLGLALFVLRKQGGKKE